MPHLLSPDELHGTLAIIRQKRTFVNTGKVELETHLSALNGMPLKGRC
jgi:hypothetical protein